MMPNIVSVEHSVSSKITTAYYANYNHKNGVVTVDLVTQSALMSSDNSIYFVTFPDGSIAEMFATHDQLILGTHFHTSMKGKLTKQG